MKTVLNKINIDTTQQPLFLGEDLSLQRYDKHKYPIFFDLFKKQLEQMWRPEEISLLNDRASYQTLSDAEKFIFTSNLKFQTMLDSVIARGIPTLQKYVSNPELEACFNTWQLFETIHSYSYTYIIKNVYADPAIIFDNILTDQEIVKRAHSVCSEYDKLIEFTGSDLKKQIYLTLISINILEAVRFYVSFVCAFSFGHNGKMVGNADIIKLIKRDESLHLYITQNLIKILQEEKSEGFKETAKECKDIAIEMFRTAAQEEKEWANYIFQYGSILGMNAEIMSQYIEWLTDTRMNALHLPKIFNTKNPIGGWIEPWMQSESVQVAPQEHELTSYKISASVADINEMDFSDI